MPKVTALKASCNNEAVTVGKLFAEAVAKYGVPSRVRGDRGRENTIVATVMVMIQGLGRGSFIWGS